jgi:hypothetical protein
MKLTSKLNTVRKKYGATRISNEVRKDKKFSAKDAIKVALRKRFPTGHVAPLKGMTTQFTTSIRNLLSR